VARIGQDVKWEIALLHQLEGFQDSRLQNIVILGQILEHGPNANQPRLVTVVVKLFWEIFCLHI